MALRKPGPKKRTTNYSANMIDTRHAEFIDQFEKNERRVEDLKKKINKGNKQLLKLRGEQRLDLLDQINSWNREVYELTNIKKKYLLDNSSHLFEYFEIKKNITEDSPAVESQSQSIKKRTVETFFKSSKNPAITTLEINESQSAATKYLRNIGDEFIDIEQFVFPSNICQSCSKGELVPLEDEGRLICNVCSRTVVYLVENEKPSYKDPPKEIFFYAYKPINHFKEILSQAQGKETTQIPPEVFERIQMQMKKERLSLKDMTNEKTKEMLKHMGLNKYYEHIAFIKNRLGIPPPIMTPELEELLCNLFVELLPAYAKVCPYDRVNFLNYAFVGYKLCEMLGQHQYLAQFPMLKDQEKRMEQEYIWKNMTKELQWEYIPTRN